MSGNNIKYRCSLSNVWVCAANFIKSGRFQTTYKYGTLEYNVLREKIAVHIRDHRNSKTYDTYFPLSLIGYALKPNKVYCGKVPQKHTKPIPRGKNKSCISIKKPEPLSWLGNVIHEHGVAQARTFERKVRDYCRQRGVNPNHLMSLMALETGGSFEPKQANMEKNLGKKGGWTPRDIKEKYLNALMKAPNGHPEEVGYPNTYPYAFGLIQFTAIAARLIGRTLWEIYNTDLNQQFEFVKMYLDKQGLGTKYKNSDQYTLYRAYA